MMRLLIAGQDRFLAENRDVLRAGLNRRRPGSSVDDTGARHAGKNGFCTQIGNYDFAWFATRTNKSRMNFLDLLRAGGHRLCHQPSGIGLYARTRPGRSRHSSVGHAPTDAVRRSVSSWRTHLDRLDITTVQVTLESDLYRHRRGMPWGSIQARTGCCARWSL